LSHDLDLINIRNSQSARRRVRRPRNHDQALIVTTETFPHQVTLVIDVAGLFAVLTTLRAGAATYRSRADSCVGRAVDRVA
jgi:hypothetical protein